MFRDEFNGNSLDQVRWTVYNNRTKNPNPTFAGNVAVAGGELRLTGAVDGPLDANGKPTDMGAGIALKLDMLYGRWEVRMRADPGAGYSAVSTLWPQSENWPTDHEIDIVEIPRPDRTSANYFVHKAPGTTSTGHKVTGYDFTKWHVFSVEWSPHGITYYLDGKQTWAVTDKTYIPIKPMHLTLQMDQSCTSSGAGCRTSATPTRVVMHVDWVKIYKLNGA